MRYDAFNNLTKRDNITWGNFNDGFETTYLNKRKVPYTGGTTDNYDYAGNVVKSEFTGSECLLPTCRTYNDTKKWNFDAAGRMTYSEHTGPWGTHTNHETITYDGDGRAVKRDEVTQEYGSIMWYYIYSSVTGQKITDLINDYYVATHIYMGGSMIAEEYNDNKGGGFAVFNLTDPVTGSLRKIGPDGTSSGDDSDGIYPTRIETAGLGMSVPLTAPQAFPLPPRRRGYTGDAESGCRIDGMAASCSTMLSMARSMGLRTIGGHIIEFTTQQRYAWDGVWLKSGDPQTVVTITAVPSPSPPPGPDYSKLRASINACAEKWHNVKLTGLKWSAKGVDGKMDFEVLKGGTVNSFNSENNTASKVSTFSVTTITTSFTSAQLGDMGGQAQSLRNMTGIYSWQGNLGGRPITRETNTVFTASDRNSLQSFGQLREGLGLLISPFVHSQIHETGNALQNIVGGNETLPDPYVDPKTGERLPYTGDNDSGMGFENCVLINYKSRLASK